MNDRRHAIIILCGIAIVGILALTITTHPFAQAPQMPGSGPVAGGRAPMPGGRAGMPGMMDGGAAGAEANTLRWEEYEMPEEKTMGYPEWLNKQRLDAVPIPRWFLREDDGKPKEYTDAQWYQLYTLYTGVAERAQRGAPGGKLISEVQKQLAVQKKEASLPQPIYEAGLDHFYFQVTYPTYNIGQVTDDGATI